MIGAVLDRNGLRPSRYVVTKDGFVVMASEVGVLDIAPENVAHKGRLQPGRMFLVDTEQGRIVGDDEIKEAMAARKPYRQWLDAEPARASTSCPPPADVPPAYDARRRCSPASRRSATRIEDLRILMAPMALNGQEAVGSMGTDTPLAVLSDKPQLLFNYFKQLFAQVTNPPIDPIREELVMSLETTHRPRAEPLRRDARALPRSSQLKSPILTNDELAQIKALDDGALRAITLADRSSRRRAAAPGCATRSTRSVRGRRGRGRQRRHASSCCPTAASTTRTRRSRACSRPPPCTIT